MDPGEAEDLIEPLLGGGNRASRTAVNQSSATSVAGASPTSSEGSSNVARDPSSQVTSVNPSLTGYNASTFLRRSSVGNQISLVSNGGNNPAPSSPNSAPTSTTVSTFPGDISTGSADSNSATGVTLRFLSSLIQNPASYFPASAARVGLGPMRMNNVMSGGNTNDDDPADSSESPRSSSQNVSNSNTVVIGRDNGNSSRRRSRFSMMADGIAAASGANTSSNSNNRRFGDEDRGSDDPTSRRILVSGSRSGTNNRVRSYAAAAAAGATGSNRQNNGSLDRSNSSSGSNQDMNNSESLMVDVLPIDNEAMKIQLDWTTMDQLLNEYLVFEGCKSEAANSNLMIIKEQITKGNVEMAISKIRDSEDIFLLQDPVLSFYLHQQAFVEDLYKLYGESSSTVIRPKLLSRVVGFTAQVQAVIADLDQEANRRGYFHSVKLKTAIISEFKRTILALMYPPSAQQPSSSENFIPGETCRSSPIHDLWSLKKRRSLINKILHKTWISIKHVEQPTLVNLIRYLTPMHAQHFALSSLGSPMEECVQNLMTSSLIRSSDDSQHLINSEVSSSHSEIELGPAYLSLSQFVPFPESEDGDSPMGGDEVSAPVHRRDLHQLEVALGVSKSMARKALIKHQNNIEKAFYYLLDFVTINRDYLTTLVKEMAEFRGLMPVDLNKVGDPASSIEAEKAKGLESLREASVKHGESTESLKAFLTLFESMTPQYLQENIDVQFRFHRFHFLLLLKEKKQMEALTFLRQVLSPLAGKEPLLEPLIRPLSGCLAYGNSEQGILKLEECFKKWNVLNDVRNCSQVAASKIGFNSPVLQKALQTLIAVHKRIYAERYDMFAKYVKLDVLGYWEEGPYEDRKVLGTGRTTGSDESGKRRRSQTQSSSYDMNNADEQSHYGTSSNSQPRALDRNFRPRPEAMDRTQSASIDGGGTSNSVENYMEAMMQRMSHLANVARRTDPVSTNNSNGNGNGNANGNNGNRNPTSTNGRGVTTSSVIHGIPSRFAEDVLDVDTIMESAVGNGNPNDNESSGPDSQSSNPNSGNIQMSEEAIETLMDMMAFSRSEARALLIRHNGVLSDVLNMLFS